MADIEERRRLVRALLNTFGRGFAEDCGFIVTNSPGNLLQLLYLSLLLAQPGDYRRAVRTAQALRDEGWNNASSLASARREDLATVLRAGGYRSPDPLAGTLGELGRAIADLYGGDLRRLRTEARRTAHRERELLNQLPGVDDRVVDPFFRDVQVLWPEVAPFADRRALAAARRLDLGRSTADLAGLAKSVESERFAWLVGALDRVDLDNRYDEVRSAARV
jgi:hypothetical protein